jgi:succinate dehydrogenase hydrophobic anchor subunit
MDLKKYDELKRKNNKKDFETSNSGLDRWLYGLSFVGNILSIFFSIFLVYPGLLKAIEINIIEGFIAKLISFTITLIILVAFEVIKRYVIRNFSNEYVRNKMKLTSTGWLTASVIIIIFSFYVSIVGSKNLGSIGTHKKGIIEKFTLFNSSS